MGIVHMFLTYVGGFCVGFWFASYGWRSKDDEMFTFAPHTGADVAAMIKSKLDKDIWTR